MRHLANIFIVAMVVFLSTGCFKEEKQGTAMKIAVYSQNVESDPIMKATDIESYAFWVKKGSSWEVSSWEDALAHCITNTERPAEQLTSPDVVGTFDAEAEYQVRIELWSPVAFIVVVDRANKVYATRLYETPMNLPSVDTQLHLYAWRKSGTANGWTTTNPFPDEERTPLVPTEEEDTTENEQATE